MSHPGRFYEQIPLNKGPGEGWGLSPQHIPDPLPLGLLRRASVLDSRGCGKENRRAWPCPKEIHLAQDKGSLTIAQASAQLSGLLLELGSVCLRPQMRTY